MLSPITATVTTMSTMKPFAGRCVTPDLMRPEHIGPTSRAGLVGAGAEMRT